VKLENALFFRVTLAIYHRRLVLHVSAYPLMGMAAVVAIAVEEGPEPLMQLTRLHRSALVALQVAIARIFL